MQKTWLDRITDESNLWLKANQMQEAGNFLEAFLLYLKDASECVEQSSQVRAALSCSCAANCLTNMGYPSEARQLYREAAILCEERADSIIGESIRESLWCLEEAYEYFVLASDRQRAEMVFYKYVSLLKRINPFLGEEAIQSLRNKNATEITRMTISANARVSEITKAIEDFLLSKKHVRISTNSISDSSTILGGRNVKFEKGTLS